LLGYPIIVYTDHKNDTFNGLKALDRIFRWLLLLEEYGATSEYLVENENVKNILAYLKTFPNGRLLINTTYPDHSIYPVEDHPNWKDFYPNAEEEISTDLSMSKVSKTKSPDDCLCKC
jgi:hypothetical protein